MQVPGTGGAVCSGPESIYLLGIMSTFSTTLPGFAKSCPCSSRDVFQELHNTHIMIYNKLASILGTVLTVVDRNHIRFIRFSMAHLKALGLLATVTLFNTAYATNACPVEETVFTGAGGIRYRICPDTDLVGRSGLVTQNVASVTACAQLCDRAMDCFKAVYDTQTRACHFKGLGLLTWSANPRFEVIQAEQVNIACCPYPETTYTSGGVSPRPVYEVETALTTMF